MLVSIRIRNLALVEDLTLDLQPGYNVITGETGAGKSILIGALSLVLGERADRTLIRAGADSCVVEAVFDLGDLKVPLAAFLEENGIEPCEEHQLVIKRTLSIGGSNRQFVNGSPTTLAVLTRLGDSLVDFHGPHEHQSLLHTGRQLDILDAFGKLEASREQVAKLVSRRAELQREISELIVDEQTYAQQLDLLRFQVHEIESAGLQPGEEEQLHRNYQRAGNAARLLQLGQGALEALSEDERSLLSQAGLVGKALQDLQRIDASSAQLSELHSTAVATLQELQSALSHYIDKIDVDPSRLEELEQRVNLIHSLKRKYGSSVAEVISFGEQARRKLESLEQRDEELVRLRTGISRLDQELWTKARELSAKRRKIIPTLAKSISRQLIDLGFKQSRLDIVLNSLEPGPETQIPQHGIDTVEFQFAPNPGEPPKPLRAIASSGELARVMLAIKTVLAAEDQIPVLVFDEIDANVGGETAHAVGDKMRQVAKKRQVLCITHLPQVAAAADAHYLVAKQTRDGRTVSLISLLDSKNRLVEVARMLGGQTDAARKHAQELLKR